MCESEVKARLCAKAKKSSCKYKVAAIAFSKKGVVLGINFSRPSRKPRYLECHAETGLIMKLGGNSIHKIVICRVNKSGVTMPIEPCDGCKNIMKRFNIKWETIAL